MSVQPLRRLSRPLSCSIHSRIQAGQFSGFRSEMEGTPSCLTEITPSSHTYERSTLTPIVSASFLLDPLTDTGRTILGLDAMCFAARGKLHGISILREYVFQIQN